MQLPCVTSPLANRSLGAIPNKQALIGSNPEEYAHAVNQLLTSPELHQLLSENGRKFVESNFSWKKSVDELAELMNED